MFNIEFNGEFAAFFIFSTIIVCGAVLMISLQKVVHMVISMAGVFLGLAGMFVLLEAEFVAFVQVLIYAGAVSILMIFGIMMTNHQDAGGEKVLPLHEGLAAIGALALFGLLFYAIRTTDFPDPLPFQGGEENTMKIGQLLYTGYIVPFELLSILLTVAFIGSIAIARRLPEKINGASGGDNAGIGGGPAGPTAQLQTKEAE
ncbi:NADH-quinone oxidoreductase subunit J [Paenibacillus radicis (ex Gao et al. 2016)]|uniref:NADH-quinone oxidoreductase subunit J n=1 Tax=Paenibacillus radicis (ex Gao et al. 2016) TaxID=1737354 RepID=A0A917HPE8_9BACL|nr:NADH-quinone oxidoreductase subunit J [Paenibacillus radicis (ex Gao et al. 2016)]GGG84919.1 NADH:ubiquinone oxidoreductase subunit J [Paenibacillus radicis (ex Gao et al. 2016)]